jgi:hypothetical protein
VNRARPIVVEAALLLAMLTLAPRVAAQPRLRVEVEGVRGELRRNVLATLSIAKKQERRRATEGYPRHLHTRARRAGTWTARSPPAGCSWISGCSNRSPSCSFAT